MPPKAAGKGKKTKAEKEKLKKEEAERKAREEEEARVRAEQEEKDREIREKEEAEARRRLENEERLKRERTDNLERKKRKGQLQDLEDLWNTNRSTLHRELAEKMAEAKWARYMRCDGTPDPTISSEINTMINLLRENSSRNDVDSVLEDSQLILPLLKELEEVMDTTKTEDLNEEDLKNYKNTCLELQLLLHEKLDFASHDLLLKAKELADPETSNLQQVINNDDITLAIWGNLIKNPRIKSHEFVEKGFLFEIPKLLTLSDCAVRVLFTEFDHLSPYSKSYYPIVKVKVEEVPQEQPEEGKQTEEEEKKVEDENPDIEREETEDLMATLKDELDMEDTEDELKTETVEQPQEEEVMEEDVEIATPEPAEYEEFDGDEDAIDLRSYRVMGGIFHFQLLHMPPQPKSVGDWILTQEVAAELKNMDYVAETPLPVTVTTKDKDTDTKDKKEIEKPPITVTMRLPENVYFLEEPQVARWEYGRKEWRLDGFSDHKYDEEKRLLTFKTSYFGTMALLQDSHTNIPFQSWEIRPRATNHTLLTIIAAIVEVEIEIQEGECRLRQPEDRPELEHIRNKWMQPRELIQRMQLAGVNVFPSQDSHRYVTIQNKNVITEERLYQQMALTASTMAYSWSKWNNEVKDKDRIVIQGSEHLKDEPLLEEQWALFLITKKRTTKLKMTEYSEAFSDDHAEGTEFNADLYHMTMETASDSGRDRIKNTSHQFIDTVLQLLQASRAVIYS